ncbi:MAG TPA: hypothetical protein V6C84_12250 [Coleofasciculaceae cyanobacterium]|jgi:hypothetical protein
MKAVVQAQDEFVLTQLVELIYQLDNRRESSYSQMIEFGLQELVRQSMRSLAVSPDYGGKQPILVQAIQQVQQQLQERLRDRPGFSLSAYTEGLHQCLKYPAKEIAELAARRQQLPQPERINNRAVVRTDAGVAIAIIRVGREEAIEALIALPESGECEVKINQLPQLYEVEGEWFPLQVTVEELSFVIDDDGRISTYTRNFPAALLEQAQQAIVHLAELIYQRAEAQ